VARHEGNLSSVCEVVFYCSLLFKSEELLVLLQQLRNDSCCVVNHLRQIVISRGSLALLLFFSFVSDEVASSCLRHCVVVLVLEKGKTDVANLKP